MCHYTRRICVFHAQILQQRSSTTISSIVGNFGRTTICANSVGVLIALQARFVNTANSTFLILWLENRYLLFASPHRSSEPQALGKNLVYKLYLSLGFLLPVVILFEFFALLVPCSHHLRCPSQLDILPQS